MHRHLFADEFGSVEDVGVARWGEVWREARGLVGGGEKGAALEGRHGGVPAQFS